MRPRSHWSRRCYLIIHARKRSGCWLISIAKPTSKGVPLCFLPAGEPKLNVDCAQVRNDICRAYGGLAEVFVAAKQLGLAREIRDTAVREYRCNKAAFDRLLPAPKINLDLAP